MITKLENLKIILTKRGIRPTFQRMSVLQFLIDNRIHPSVDAIYEQLVLEIPSMSRTTIYNTLHIFLEKHIVSEIIITGLDIRFEINPNPHHHFLCAKCNQIYDIPIECCQFNSEKVKDHKILEMHGYFKGICRECLDKGLE
jgi:Fe2+ or Zn2+ uptake regulation protein